MTSKQYANGTAQSIAYESSISLVGMVTDALYQTKTYTHNADNTTASISFSANQATPSVSFTYDPNYRRVTSMTDGTGTTMYTYYPVTAALGANQLESVTSAVAGTANSDTAAYTYDALNRVVGTTINGAAQSMAFDALGRVTAAQNPLDSFTYAYADATYRVSGITSSSGPTASSSYFGPTGDELLQQLNYATHSGGTSLAQFGYTYNADNNVTGETVSSPAAQTTAYTYDAANRLLSGLYSGSTPQYAYVYDSASNPTSITTNGSTQTFSFSSTNTPTASNYDVNGITLGLGGNTYTWDGANRVVSVANATANTSSTFTYDGLSRLVRIVDSHSGSVVADHAYTWCGATRCLAHDNTQSNSPVSTQYFRQGVIVGATSYYYVQDELGSVSELVTSSGSIAAQYTYDPYGNKTTVSGTVAPTSATPATSTTPPVA